MTDIEIVAKTNILGETLYYGSAVEYWFKFLGVRWFSIRKNLRCENAHEYLTPHAKAKGFRNKEAVITHINRLLEEEAMDEKRSIILHTQKEIIPKRK